MSWEPKVGDGAHMCLHTDCHSYTVVKVSASGKTIWCQRDKATLLNGCNSGEPDALTFTPGGFFGHTSGAQRWKIEPDPEGQIMKATRRLLPTGTVIYKQARSRTLSPGFRVTEGHYEHYDFNY